MLKKYYHGTSKKAAKDILENGINLDIGRTKNDFGKGFYATENYKQAARWAGNTNDSAVVAFYCDTDKLSGVTFTGFTDDWKDAIYSNRVCGIDIYLDKDYVEGPLADGKARQLAEKVKRGRISQKLFYKEISQANIGSQIVFKTKKAINELKMMHISEEGDE